MSPAGRRVLIAVGILVTLLFGWLAVRGTHPREVWQALRDSNPLWILASTAFALGGVALRAVRWRALFPRETRPALRPILASTLVGYFFNSVLPLRAGEAARIVDLNRRTYASRAETTATVGLERAYDLGTTLLLLFATLYWLPELTWIRAAGVLALVLGVGLVAAALTLAFFGDRPLRFVTRPLRRLLEEERVEAVSASFHRGLAGLRRPGVALAALAWTLAAWAVTVVAAWLLFFAFDLELSPAAGVLVVVTGALAMILPSSPGALGVFEAATVLALDAYGVDRGEALSYALVWHALNVLPLVATGWIPLARMPARGSR